MSALVRNQIAAVQRSIGEQARDIAGAAAVLHTATRAWGTLPPVNRAELNAVSAQIVGLQRSINELRATIQDPK